MYQAFPPPLERLGTRLCKTVLGLPLSSMYAWTDSTIVLAWNPRRFKVYVGNRIAQILELTTASCWNHVASEDNPADCASRGMFPSELLTHDLWWCGPSWLKLQQSKWPKFDAPASVSQEEEEELNITTCALAVVEEPLTPVDKLSSFNSYKRVTAWVIRFLHNCKAKIESKESKTGPLTSEELDVAANYWYALVQKTHFPDELRILAKESRKVPTSSRICSSIPSLTIREY